GANSDRVLLRVLAHHPAAARAVRENQAAAELDLGIGAARRRSSRRVGGAAAGRRGLERPAMNAHRSIILALALAASLAVAGTRTVCAQEEEEAPPLQRWSFHGPFGLYDPEQLQRGFKIYREVCSTCHGLKLLAFRN